MSQDLHILLVSSKYLPEYSGSGYRAHHLYQRLKAKIPSLELSVLTGSTTENTCETYSLDGFNIVRVSQKPYPELSRKAWLRHFQITANFHAEYDKTKRFLSRMERKPDLVHVFGESYVSATVIDFAIKQKIPLLIEICNEVESPFQYVPVLHRLCMKRQPDPDLSCYICISENLKNMCQRNGISENQIWCRPNPIDEKRFRPVNTDEKWAFRNKHTRFGQQDKLIAYVANYRPSKNHAFLLEVIKKLPDEYKLFMKGPLVESGPLGERNRALYQSLQQQISDESLSNRVQLESGFADQVEELYQMSDVYAFPSLTEGLGTPVLESLACAVPVVSNLIPDTTDVWIKNDVNGFLSTLDPGLFADNITKAVEFPTEKCHREARKIIKIAGTETIDHQYIELIKKY